MQALIIIATVLSVILSVIRVIDFIKEKYNVKVRVKGNSIIFDGTEISKKNTYIIISIINIGKEPVTIINAGLLSPEIKGCYLFKNSIRNQKLNTSDCIDYPMLEEIVKKKFDISKRKYAAYACDNAGRVYYSHNFIKRLIRIHKIK